MRREVLDGRDTLTVGECSGVTLEEALKYASLDGKELNMVFQFEHMDLDFDENGNKWTDRKCKLSQLKEILSRWQAGLYKKAWNSLFWCNHDQPRVVSRLGNDSAQYREVSAKMLAVCSHMMQGTPYIYQGEEMCIRDRLWASPAGMMKASPFFRREFAPAMWNSPHPSNRKWTVKYG